MALDSGERSYGCLFCRSGSEERIIGDLQRSHPGLQCISPKRVRVRRQGGKDLDTLIPGYFDGDTVRILDGPLKVYEKHITKFDKRAKTAQVQFDFQDKLMTIWLGFEIEESGLI